VVLSAAVKLIAAGTASDPADALRRAEAVLDDGRAAATLDALLG
jgi:anthranilate phosphoribosyltransferase